MKVPRGAHPRAIFLFIRCPGNEDEGGRGGGLRGQGWGFFWIVNKPTSKCLWLPRCDNRFTRYKPIIILENLHQFSRQFSN